MKKNSYKVLVSSSSTEWYTPKVLFDELNSNFNFTLDAASSDTNCLVKKHYTIQDDALTKDWSNEVVFCNPPYNKNPLWFKKFTESGAKSIVAIVPVRAGAKYWFKYVYPHAKELFIFEGRLRFENANDSAPFDTCLILWGKGNLNIKNYKGLTINLEKLRESRYEY